MNGATSLKVASFLRNCLNEVQGRDRNTEPWFVLIREHSESQVQEHPLTAMAAASQFIVSGTLLHFLNNIP